MDNGYKNNGYIETPNTNGYNNGNPYGNMNMNMGTGNPYGNVANMNGLQGRPGNKKKGIILAIVILLLICCCGLGGIVTWAISLAGKEKEALSIDEIQAIMEGLGYDNSNGDIMTSEWMYDYNTFDYSISVSASIYTENSSAVGQMDDYKDIWDYDKSTTNSEVNGKNYNCVKWVMDDMYIGVIRVGNEIITISTWDKAVRNEIFEALDKATN